MPPKSGPSPRPPVGAACLSFRCCPIRWICILKQFKLDIRHLVLHSDWMLIFFPSDLVGIVHWIWILIYYHLQLPLILAWCQWCGPMGSLGRLGLVLDRPESHRPVSFW